MTTITTDNVFTLVASGEITMEEGQKWMLAENQRIASEASAASAGKVHYGVTAGGAINLRGVPGSAGSFGLTLYGKTVEWLAANLEDVLAHCQKHATEDFQRGSDGRLVRVTSDKEESQSQKARCTLEIARWIIEAEDQVRLFGKDSVDDEWATMLAESDPEGLGGVYPVKKLVTLVKKGDYPKDVVAAIKAERKATATADKAAEESAEEAAEESAEAAE